MSTMVMVHGAGDGAWAWTPVVRRLRRLGHEVFAVTLTGYGERSHLASPAVTLDMHVADVVNLIEYEQLNQVWLVVHSYGGWVATAAAQRLAGRLAHLIYVDAVFPTRDRQRYRDLFDPAVVARVERLVGDGGWLVPKSPDVEDVRCVPMLWRPLCAAISLGPEAAALPRTYIAFTARGSNWRYAPIASAAEQAAMRGWPVIALPGDHNYHESHPDEVASVLHGVMAQAEA
jgi:pimeloyl-ACP methyl ester carboxylesterase